MASSPLMKKGEAFSVVNFCSVGVMKLWGSRIKYKGVRE